MEILEDESNSLAGACLDHLESSYTVSNVAREAFTDATYAMSYEPIADGLVAFIARNRDAVTKSKKWGEALKENLSASSRLGEASSAAAIERIRWVGTLLSKIELAAAKLA